MSVIAIATAPGGNTRVFFDCRDAVPDPADERWIERTIEQSLALDRTDGVAAGDGSAVRCCQARSVAAE